METDLEHNLCRLIYGYGYNHAGEAGTVKKRHKYALRFTSTQPAQDDVSHADQTCHKTWCIALENRDQGYAMIV